MEDEWGTYLERFNRLPVDEQSTRVKQQGYEQFRDILAHILAWWDEGMEVILALAEGREFERRKYDFDAFNAEAVAKYRSWDEAVFENRRVKAWIRGVVISHAREHLVALSRFLVVDMLANEWGTYIADFNRLDDFFLNKDIEGWLRDDVVEHFNEHAISA